MHDLVAGSLAEACGNAATSSQCYERIFQDMNLVTQPTRLSNFLFRPSPYLTSVPLLRQSMLM